MIADALRRILYPAFVVTIIATLWALGHAQAMADQAYNRRYWPPQDPALFRCVEDADAAYPPEPFGAAAADPVFDEF